jgi:hypothetical protein
MSKIMFTIQMIAPDLPGIEGLSFRPLRGEEDTEALYAVHTGRVAHDQVDLSLHSEDIPSLESLRRYISQAVVKSEQDY